MLIRLSPTLFSILGLALLLPGTSAGQAFNVDLANVSGGAPSDAYGAASGQGGHWQNALLGPTLLDDVEGNPTAIQYSSTFTNAFGSLGLTEDVDKLLRDCARVTSGPWTVTLSGLAPGQYRLYLYGYSSSIASIQSGFMTVEGVPTDTLTGFGDGGLLEGSNWLSVDVRVGADGLLVIDSPGSGSSSGLAGFQLVPLSRIGVNVDFGTFYGVPSVAFGAAASRPGDWNQVGLGFSILDDLGGSTSDLSILVDADSASGSTGTTPTTDPEELLADNIFGQNGNGWRVDIAGLAPGTYDVYVYASSNTVVPTGDMVVGGVAIPSIPGRIDSVLEQGVSWSAVTIELADDPLTITGALAGFSGIAGLQVVPSVRQRLNVDLGISEGTPGSDYGAAGAAGYWNEAGVGVSALDDAAGVPSGVSLDVVAATTGVANPASDDDGRLLEDHIAGFQDGPVSLVFSGLAPGRYRVFVYAPSSTGVETGPLTIEGVAVPTLPGVAGSTLVEGASWASADVIVGDDRVLSVASAGAPTAGLAGVQVVPLEPQALNVDFGEDYARPYDDFGAASGQAGRWFEAPIGSWVLDEIGGSVSGIGLVVDGDTTDTYSPSSFPDDDEALLEDSVTGTVSAPWSARFTGLAPGDYTVYLYAPSTFSFATGAATIDGMMIVSLPGVVDSQLIEGLSWIAVDVTIDDFDLVVAGPAETAGVAGIQIVPRASTPLNIDFGQELGAPSDTFGGAAGRPGVWNSITNGVSPLLGLSGELSGASANVYAESATDDTGETPVTDEDRLLDDYLLGDGAPVWFVEIAGIAAGDYRVYIYGPPQLGSFPTGTISVGGIPLPTLPGDPNSMLVPAVSWTAVAVTVTDTLLIVGNGEIPDYGISGLQVVPVPEPGGGVLLGSGCAALWLMARRRANRRSTFTPGARRNSDSRH